MTANEAKHWHALRTCSKVIMWYRHMYDKKAVRVRAEKVICILDRASVRFVLMGSHATSGYRDEAQATGDIDVLVQARDHRNAVLALQIGYPTLVVSEESEKTRLQDRKTGRVAVDVMKPVDRLRRLVFKNAQRINGRYLIPDLDMTIACKFAVMMSPCRALSKQLVDAGDFMNMVKTNRDEIDLERLRAFGGQELVEYVQDVLADRVPKFLRKTWVNRFLSEE